MPSEFVVTSPAASGVGALKVHYATVEAALRFANVLLDDGAALVWIADGEGKMVLREEQIRLTNKLIEQNIRAREFLLVMLHNFQTGVYRFGAYNHCNQGEDIILQWICQLSAWISERDSLTLDLDRLIGGFFVDDQIPSEVGDVASMPMSAVIESAKFAR